MRKILCVTLNPAMDKTIIVDDYKEGHVNIIDEMHYEIGGKGINVAKILNNFSVYNIVTGFSGGMWSDMLRTRLMRLGIESKFFKLIQDSRTNTKLIDRKKGICTTIKEKGPFVPEEMTERFIQSFERMCHMEDLVILTGALPPGVPKDMYSKLTKIAKQKGAYVILDAKREDLENLGDIKPDFIKITYREYIDEEGWYHLEEKDLGQIVRKIQEKKMPPTLVSVGKLGALFVETEKAYFAPALSTEVRLKYPVGAGDAMVAAVVIAKLNEMEAFDMLRYAVAFGAACVYTKDTSNCIPEVVEKLVEQVTIKEMNIN